MVLDHGIESASCFSSWFFLNTLYWHVVLYKHMVFYSWFYEVPYLYKEGPLSFGMVGYGMKKTYLLNIGVFSSLFL
jgi:hypothetical protein